MKGRGNLGLLFNIAKNGSMEGKKIMERIEELKQVEEEKNTSKEEKRLVKVRQEEAFIRCKERCVCLQNVCGAKGLRQCSSCMQVMKSKCSKRNCKEYSVVEMILPSCDKRNKTVLRVEDVYTSESELENDIL